MQLLFKYILLLLILLLGINTFYRSYLFIKATIKVDDILKEFKKKNGRGMNSKEHSKAIKNEYSTKDMFILFISFVLLIVLFFLYIVYTN